MIEALAAGLALASVALATFAVRTTSQSLKNVLELLALERKEAREDAAALANRLVYPQVYQPTPAQREEGREARENPPEPDPWAAEFEAAGTIDNSIPDPDQMLLVGEGPDDQ